jgi:hypothetical protein
MNATATPTVFVPQNAIVRDGLQWLCFDMDTTTFAEFKAWPKTMRYGTATMMKSGWNSDTQTITYKQFLGIVGEAQS